MTLMTLVISAVGSCFCWALKNHIHILREQGHEILDAIGLLRRLPLLVHQ